MSAHAQSHEPVVADLVDELRWRGLFHQCTDEDGLRAHLADPEGTPRKIYAGFDPTADSLTIGNLVPIMLLAHVKRAGHEAVVLMGGGTGLIGDPSGKSAERTLNTAETVGRFVECQRPIFESVLGKIPGRAHKLVNNADWLTKISYIEALRDIGKHFSVNMMMQKESVKARLENREQGISYTEFSYMILQAYDFLHLYRDEGVTVQLGGSDQFGNIVAGSDLIRRVVVEPKAANEEGHAAFWYARVEQFRNQPWRVAEFTDDAKRHEANAKWIRDTEGGFGLTVPLVTKADGGKFGKTEAGAVWLTRERTSPYAYYQFWLNATDEDALNWLRVFTFLSREEIQAIESAHNAEPHKREAQRRLAQEATTILYGADEMRKAEEAGKALFSGDLASLDEVTLKEVFASVPTTEFDRVDLTGGEGGEGYDLVELLKSVGLASSNREAREFLTNGSVSINGEKVGIDDRLNEGHLLHGSYAAIRRGKKKWHLTRWA